MPIYFVMGFGMICESLDVHIYISTPLGDFVIVDIVLFLYGDFYGV